MLCYFSAMRIHFISEGQFERSVDDDDNSTISRITGYFHTFPVVLTEGESELDLASLIAEFNEQVDQFTCRGSGYVLIAIKKLKMVFVPFQPFADGSSYIPTPAWLAKKRAVVNVKNVYDNECFKWPVLSALYPAESHVDRLTNYLLYEKKADCSSLTFPVQPKQFSLFERDNPSIALHCLTYDVSKNSFSILYLSQYMHERPYKISLLLLDSAHGDDNRHYVWIKNLSRLVSSNYTYNHAHYVCLSCLHPFTKQYTLEKHEPQCLMHRPQQCMYPDGDKALLRYERIQYEFLFPFYLVADFECFLAVDDDETLHRPSGFCIYRVSRYESYRTEPYTYLGGDVMEHFFEYIFK